MNTEELKKMHETFLYPVVRVFAQKAAGSGTIIYSKPDPKNPDEYQTFILTNEHVIDDLIKHKKDWDSLLKQNIEKEFLEMAKVETFSYVNMSTVDSSNRYNAEIIAYDKAHDLAVLKLDSPRKFEYVAKLIPRERIKDLRLFMDIVVSGCSLAHEPFCTFGQLTFLKEIIDQKRYLMSSGNGYFGNSGGALFLKDTGELIGVPSRLTGVQLGFGIDMVSFMLFSAHPERIYEFIDEQELRFLYDPNDDYYSAMERRKKKKEEALMALKAEVAKQQVASNRSGGETV